jgi:hypothetical protein
MNSNGRVNLTQSIKSAGGFLADPAAGGFGYQTTVDSNVDRAMLKGNWSANGLSAAFFSAENIKTIQNQLKNSVYKISGHQIDDQSVDELQIIMRSLYLQYAKNLPYDIPGQVAELNKAVIDWSVPTIISAIQMDLHYQKDLNKLPIPMAHPTWMSSAGTRGAEVKKFI